MNFNCYINLGFQHRKKITFDQEIYLCVEAGPELGREAQPEEESDHLIACRQAGGGTRVAAEESKTLEVVGLSFWVDWSFVEGSENGQNCRGCWRLNRSWDVILGSETFDQQKKLRERTLRRVIETSCQRLESERQ